ncbi:sensor histidine kinase [Novilysobacter defluvii]|uniref:histidine kinase n=1 Tax=Lysobacter defluvii IMMIB APB-9 = DSM 18482 TaxID=1385515 RepID=A0A0A0MA87_9GAMM|nr:HAMP domain-containing sensor histidine kinase [Lysobacter defluvii]KGO98922.1 histidine kinase [Lysobacter defluvii IMMIB APB-9 = DSM 18482]
MAAADNAAPRRRPRHRRRLRTRIILSFVLLGFGLTTLFALATLYVQGRLENQLVERTLEREVSNLVMQVEQNPDEPPFFLIFDARTWSPKNAFKVDPLYRDLEPGIHNVRQQAPDGSWHDYKVAVRQGVSPNGTPFTSLVRYDVTGAAEASTKLMRALVISVVLFSLLSLMLGWWSASRVMSPVSELARRLKLSGRSSQPEALALHFPDDEVGQLAEALDDYAERLTEVVQRDREFNADVSHELRTPLAVIKGAVELLLSRPGLDEKTEARLLRIQRAEQQCTDLISALLLLSRNERGHGATEVAKVAAQLLEIHRAQLRGKDVELRLEGSDAPVVDAPESAVTVALGNLIGNAVKYTAQGEVVVRLMGNAVEVRDSGPGLSEEDAANLFRRGYRGTHSGPSQGGGIGLSIVRRLCDLYGWDVRVASGGPTHGVVATLYFDAGADPA